MNPVPTRWRSRPAVLLAVATAALLVAVPAAGQQDADFLFSTPKVTLGIHGGVAVAGANSDIFDFISDTLTVDKGDFTSAALRGEIGVRATDRIDIALNVGFSRGESHSEYRNWVEEVDDVDLPIEQTTTFIRVPITLGAKVYLMDRGRSIGRFAWIPSVWSPYVGVGGGITPYRFEQKGDWVDYQTFEIFSDRFVSEGSAPTAYLNAGADISLGPRFVFNMDGRYTWADSEMGRDFDDFDDIDLGGFDATFGFGVRF